MRMRMSGISHKRSCFFSVQSGIDISLNRLEHYTATQPADFQRYILFTNYDMHVEGIHLSLS